ncbi:hypothetical protein SAMN05444483_101277 [Salegentibacter echinorum]|uniref:Uncharacterized protein n=1 Tax=Salegentibacter echinorum TaxID=1073325 RepID=A0A1M5C0H4_SALEC|nr:hypothetical protein SAMN05444483_101277 [Salegentibacter echinorum]
MFSTGQLIFAGIFLIAFIIVISSSYKKDSVLHKKHYKGSFFVLIGFLLFLGLLFIIKTTLNH